LDAYRRLRGPRHQQVALAFDLLGAIAGLRGDNAIAADYFEQARVLAIDVYGADHPFPAGIAVNLAKVEIHLGHLDRSETLLRDALDVLERTRGPADDPVAPVMSSLCELALEGGDIEQARSIYEKTIERDHPHLGVVLGNLGRLAFQRGDLAEAEPQWLERETTADGSDHEVVQAVAEALAAHLLLSRDPIAARARAVAVAARFRALGHDGSANRVDKWRELGPTGRPARHGP